MMMQFLGKKAIQESCPMAINIFTKLQLGRRAFITCRSDPKEAAVDLTLIVKNKKSLQYV